MGNFHKTELTFIVFGEQIEITVESYRPFADLRRMALEKVEIGDLAPEDFEIRCSRGSRIDPKTYLDDELRKNTSRQFFLSLPVGFGG